MHSTESSIRPRAAISPARTRRHVALSATLALILSALTAATLSLVTMSPAEASHYRANGLTWHAGEAPNSVEFHVNGSWRCDYVGACNYAVGDPLTSFVASPLEFGDGDYQDPEFTVTASDTVNNVVSAEAHVEHTYAGPGPWVASLNDCCRLSSFNGHMNNGDGSIRFETLVDLTRDSSAPVALVAPIVDSEFVKVNEASGCQAAA